MATKHKELDALIESLGLGYTAVFIPQSKSRSAGEKNPSLNWRITISKGTHSSQQLTTEYTQSIAHVPGYQHEFGSSGWKDKFFAESAETGKYTLFRVKFSNGKTDWWSIINRAHLSLKYEPLPAPALRDVLYSLVLDYDVLDYYSFEEWAPNFGYEIDSRSAEKLYRLCLEIALKVRSFLGDSTLMKLREAFQDY